MHFEITEIRVEYAELSFNGNDAKDVQGGKTEPRMDREGHSNYLMNERVVKRFFADNIINECEWELSTERKDNLSVLEIILISSTKSGQHKLLQK